MLCRLCFLVTASLIAAIPTSADETTDKLKAAAVANLKTVGLGEASVVETANLIVCSTQPASKTKVLADSLEKVYAMARKGLQYETTEEPWKGKLTIYVIEERRPFQLFLLQVAKDRTKDPYFIAVRSDPPFIVKGLEVGQKSTDAETAAEAGKLLAAALLSAKMGGTSTPPDWIRFGFGRAAVARAAGQGSKPLNDLRSKARTAISTRPPAKAEDAWTTQNEELDASVMDYIAFGPTAAMNLSKFLTANRPGENGEPPTMDAVLMAMMWTKDDLDKAWKKYVLTGK